MSGVSCHQSLARRRARHTSGVLLLVGQEGDLLRAVRALRLPALRWPRGRGEHRGAGRGGGGELLLGLLQALLGEGVEWEQMRKKAAEAIVWCGPSPKDRRRSEKNFKMASRQHSPQQVSIPSHYATNTIPCADNVHSCMECRMSECSFIHFLHPFNRASIHPFVDSLPSSLTFPITHPH